jgi:hypothetical protein
MGQIKIKQRTLNDLLRRIVDAMNEYYRLTPVSTSMVSCVFDVVLGVFMAIIGVSFLI